MEYVNWSIFWGEDSLAKPGSRVVHEIASMNRFIIDQTIALSGAVRSKKITAENIDICRREQKIVSFLRVGLRAGLGWALAQAGKRELKGDMIEKIIQINPVITNQDKPNPRL